MRSYLLRLMHQVAWLPMCLPALLWPRDPRLWVFGAWHGRQYADNTGHLYRHVRDHEPALRGVWLTHDAEVVRQVRQEGGEAAMAYSLQGILLSLRAGRVLVTHSAEDVNSHASLGAELVNLTHGTPLKRMGRDARSRRIGHLTACFDRYLKRLLPGKRRANRVLVASAVGRERMASAYGLDPARVMALGYPRWDAFRTDARALLARHGIETRSCAGILLYAPTVRMQGQGVLDLAQGGALAALRSWLERERLLLLIRGHASLCMRGLDELIREGRCIREVPVTQFPDVNALLPAVDMLITDYSSVMYDYACLERPIVLMAPDLETYLDQDVGIYGDYTEDAPGPVITRWTQLPVAWAELQSGLHADRLKAFVDRHAALYDTEVCSRVVACLNERDTRLASEVT
ncbi:CDP-glycerol:poly(glycerophosphate) glycerophosphotransferase [Halomonas sp. THAF5a]|uniref:CDP-glycerol glycerophosphotransferase family protein n=1 Tax=Halomonas sp. THAF5a TaxID=2587844 RepID=UPI0012A88A21|nr:CDP-glycerol glycerophosphotransferase family protein [Halomonas sp. THAF5a]QFU01532.1 CDP-glycerol:poly(glycerophosphate) glycerophosphotransferase [Halomonas sp. THAF5a]